jgi:ABC-2 type transport system ATP-binding protein
LPIIETQNLSKSFDGKNYAVENLSLSISPGEILGFLGPNGSGKTTTVRLINGILKPASGKIFIKDEELTSKNTDIVHKISGVLTENAEFYEYLTGYQNLLFFGTMFKMENASLKLKCEELLKRFEIYDAKDMPVKTYSTGMKKRLKLVRAFLNNPEIVFLDEPTSGLDPEGAKIVTDFIKQAAVDFKVTVFLCTHQLKYAEDICTMYAFLDKGKMIAYGKFDELLKNVDSSVYLEVKGKNFPSSIESSTPDFISNTFLSARLHGNEDAGKIIKEIILKGGSIYEAVQKKMDLEDLYFAIQKKHNGK